MHFIIGLFELWSVAFWIMAIILGVITAAFVENEHGGISAWITAIYLVGLDQFGHVPVWFTIRHHPLLAIFWASLYVIAGVIYLLGKWSLFCLDKRRPWHRYEANLPERSLTSY